MLGIQAPGLLTKNQSNDRCTMMLVALIGRGANCGTMPTTPMTMTMTYEVNISGNLCYRSSLSKLDCSNPVVSDEVGMRNRGFWAKLNIDGDPAIARFTWL